MLTIVLWMLHAVMVSTTADTQEGWAGTGRNQDFKVLHAYFNAMMATPRQIK
jgi:hypothetical protein